MDSKRFAKYTYYKLISHTRHNTDRYWMISYNERKRSICHQCNLITLGRVGSTSKPLSYTHDNMELMSNSLNSRGWKGQFSWGWFAIITNYRYVRSTPSGGNNLPCVIESKTAGTWDHHAGLHYEFCRRGICMNLMRSSSFLWFDSFAISIKAPSHWENTARYV